MTTLAVSTMPADAAEHADAEMLTLCADFEAIVRRFNGLWAWRIWGTDQELRGPRYIHDDDERGKAMEPLQKRMSDLSAAIVASPPVTLAGFRAVARCILLSCGPVRDAVCDDGINVCNQGAHNGPLDFSNEEWQLAVALLYGLVGNTISDTTCFDGPGVLVEYKA